MTKSEIAKAERMLRPYVERTETMIDSPDGARRVSQCLTAYWRDGGQTRFDNLVEVDDRVQEIVVRHEAARMLGSIRTEKKAASSRENGKRGGRPRTISAGLKAGEREE